MSMKDIFFYPAIVLSAGWTLLNFAKVGQYVNELKAEFPVCTAKNPNQVVIFLATIAIMMTLKSPSEYISRRFFDLILSTTKFPAGTKERS